MAYPPRNRSENACRISQQYRWNWGRPDTKLLALSLNLTTRLLAAWRIDRQIRNLVCLTCKLFMQKPFVRHRPTAVSLLHVDRCVHSTKLCTLWVSGVTGASGVHSLHQAPHMGELPRQPGCWVQLPWSAPPGSIDVASFQEFAAVILPPAS